MGDLAEVCLKYLSSDAFEVPLDEQEPPTSLERSSEWGVITDPCKLSQDPKWYSSKSYGYAAKFWGQHARQASTSYDHVMSFLLSKNVESAGRLLEGFILRIAIDRISPRVTCINALHLAARFGLESATKALLEHTSNPDIFDSRHATPLMLAITYGHLDVCKLLISKGASPLRVGKSSSPLLNTIYSGSVDIVKMILDAGAKVESREGFPLVSASSQSRSMVEVLLDYGSDPNSVSYMSALEMAAIEGLIDVVDLLIHHGANPNLETKLGYAIHRAAFGGRIDLVDFLIQRGANPNRETRHGQAIH